MVTASLSTRAVSLSDHVKRRKNSALSKRGSDNILCGATGSSSDSSSKYGITTSAATTTTTNNNIGSASIATNSPLKIYSPQHPPPPGPILMGSSNSSREEGGYDSHVASYGNYDAPSAHCRSYHASEHGCYAAESHIFGGGVGGGDGIGGMGWRNHAAAATATNYNSSSNKNKAAIHNMARLESYSNPLLDLEEQRYICSTSRQRRTPKNASTSVQQQQQQQLPPLPPSTSSGTMMCVPQGGRSGGGGGRTTRETWDNYSHDPRCQGDSSSFCSNAPTASTVGSCSNSSSNSSTSSYSHPSMDATSSIPPLDEDAIRQGILDFSTLVATYLAGALSFIIGIFLTLLSPLVKIIKCIVGDVLGLLGDAGFLNELGSLWRLYRDLHRSSERSHYSSASNGDYHQYSNHHSPRYQDDTSLEDGSTTVYSGETSTQFVGGWRPHVCPSVGSGCSSSVNTPNSTGRTRPSSSLSSWGGGVTVNASASSPRSHSFLPSNQGARQGPRVFPTSKNSDEVSSCPPNIMMRHPQATQCSESSLYYTSRNNDAYVRRSTDLSHHQSLLQPGTQYNTSSLYPQTPTHRYPRSKSDVTS